MMTILVLALVLMMVVVIIIASKKTGQTFYPYKAKTVLTKPEQILFFRLVKALPDYIVISQVQMSSFLDVTVSGKMKLSALNRIRMKSCDFLVCRSDFSVVGAVELQDGSHNRRDRQKSDAFKRSALTAANLPLVVYHVSDLPTPEQIRAAFAQDSSPMKS
ncbi:MAG: DUF2726 domain-containing protein [Betaproteobacteria bacterium]|nr:DUF2726 domain-containing protein [Betaproteobacteria bacterium]